MAGSILWDFAKDKYDTEDQLKKLSDAYDKLRTPDSPTVWGYEGMSKLDKMVMPGNKGLEGIYTQGSFQIANPEAYKSILGYRASNSKQNKSLNQGQGGAASILGGSVN